MVIVLNSLILYIPVALILFATVIFLQVKYLKQLRKTPLRNDILILFSIISLVDLLPVSFAIHINLNSIYNNSTCKVLCYIATSMYSIVLILFVRKLSGDAGKYVVNVPNGIIRAIIYFIFINFLIIGSYIVGIKLGDDYQIGLGDLFKPLTSFDLGLFIFQLAVSMLAVLLFLGYLLVISYLFEKY